MRKKITVIGAGNVGATAAHWAMVKRLRSTDGPKDSDLFTQHCQE